MINPKKKKAFKVAEAKKTTQYIKCLHFGIFEVKEAVKVVEAVGANEATEVVRFTQGLEFNNVEGEQKKKYTNVFKSGGNILGQSGCQGHHG